MKSESTNDTEPGGAFKPLRVPHFALDKLGQFRILHGPQFWGAVDALRGKLEQ